MCQKTTVRLAIMMIVMKIGKLIPPFTVELVHAYNSNAVENSQNELDKCKNMENKNNKTIL